MLYQPARFAKAENLFATIVAGIAGLLGNLARQFSDGHYLDGMRAQELEDLGLRRTETRDYRPYL